MSPTLYNFSKLKGQKTTDLKKKKTRGAYIMQGTDGEKLVDCILKTEEMGRLRGTILTH